MVGYAALLAHPTFLLAYPTFLLFCLNKCFFANHSIQNPETIDASHLRIVFKGISRNLLITFYFCAERMLVYAIRSRSLMKMSAAALGHVLYRPSHSNSSRVLRQIGVLHPSAF